MKGRSVFNVVMALTVLASIFLSSLLKSQPSLARSEVNNSILLTEELAQIDRTQSISNNQTLIAQNKAPQRFIDIWTDNIFSNLHPELSGRKVQSSETKYIREWQAIQTVIANNLTPKKGCTGDSGWGLSDFDGVEVRTGKRLLTSTVLDKVADAIFYTRHPELGDRKIQPGEYKLTNEWMKIRQAIWTMPWC